jgi:Membrane bound O-acyl transferase family
MKDDSAPPVLWPYQETGDPRLLSPPLFRAASFDVFLPVTYFWLNLLLVLYLQVLVTAFLAAIPLYYFYIQHVRSETGLKDTETGTHQQRLYMIGYGYIVPMCILLPPLTIQYFQIPNLVFRFSVMVIFPTLIAFRTIAVMHGFAPNHIRAIVAMTESSTPGRDSNSFTSLGFQHFVVWYATPLLFNVKRLRISEDGRLQQRASFHDVYFPTNSKRLIGFGLKYVLLLLVTGLYQALFDVNNQKVLRSYFPVTTNFIPTMGAGPFPIEERMPYERTLTAALTDPYHWIQCVSFAILFFLYLHVFGTSQQLLIESLIRYQTHPIMDDPVFSSRSPSDFWGRRWNLIIHDALKNGAYKPVRSLTNSATAGSVAAFLASAAFHENIVLQVFADTYPYRHGPTTGFFLWQAALIVLESWILSANRTPKHGSTSEDSSNGSSSNGQQIPATLPSVMGSVMATLRSLLVVWMGVPLAYWFLEPYVRSDFLLHGGHSHFTFRFH